MTTDPRAELEARWDVDRRVRWLTMVIAWCVGLAVTIAMMRWLGEWPGAPVGWVVSFGAGVFGRPWVVWAATRIIDRYDR